MDDLTPVVVALIMAAGAAGGTVLTMLFSRRERRVKVQVDMGQLSLQWAESFRADAASARASAADAAAEVQALRDYVHALLVALRQHGIEPPPFPRADKET